MQAEVSTAAGSTEHPGSTLQGLEDSVGTQDRSRGVQAPHSPSLRFFSQPGPRVQRERSLSVQGSPFRLCLGLWNNRWCFYNLSEACSWVDGERQYLRTTGLQEVVKLLLPIYIFLTMLSLRSVSSFFFIFFNFIFISLLWQSVSPFFFFFSPPLSSSPFHFDLSNCKSYFKLTWRH